MLLAYILLFILLIPIYYLAGNIVLLYLCKNNNFSSNEKILFSFGISFGLVYFLIYLLGVTHILYDWVIWVVTFIFILLNIRKLIDLYKKSPHKIYNAIHNLYKQFVASSLVFKIIIICFLAFLTIAFLGAISPEISFDGLWYHLEMPKIYLAEHRLVNFSYPAWLSLLGSVPRLVDLNFAYLMSFGGAEILPKLFSFSALALSILVLYEFCKKLDFVKYIWIPIVLLFCSQSIQWLSATAYIDFGSLFYGLLSLYVFYFWIKQDDNHLFWLCTIFTGLALSTKLWNILLVPTFILLLILNKKYKHILYMLIVPVLIASPFFIHSYYYTHNPIFPVFSAYASDYVSSTGATNLRDWIFNIHSKQFLQIIYNDFLVQSFIIVLAPFALLSKNNWSKYWMIFIFAISNLVIWSFIPVHEPRYAFTFLGSWLIISVIGFISLKNYSKIVRYCVWFFLYIYLLANIIFFANASKEFILPKISEQSRSDYLSKNLKTNIWTYYDTTGYFSQNINPDDKIFVLIHNMYYIDFNYFDMTRAYNNLYNIQSKEELLDYLGDNNYTHLLFQGPYSIEDFKKRMPNIVLDESWIDKHLLLIYRIPEKNMNLYKINY